MTEGVPPETCEKTEPAMRQHHRVLGKAVLALFAGQSEAGLLVYSNGDQNFGPNNSFSYGNVFVGQDFTLNTDAVLSQLVFNAHTVEGVTVPTTDVRVKIYSVLALGVGPELFSGIFPVVSETVTGTTPATKYKPSYTLKDFEVNLPFWSLAAGTYWLGLQVDPAQREMHWTITGGFASIGLPSQSEIMPANRAATVRADATTMKTTSDYSLLSQL
jgi:hypothetical protein